MAWVNVFDVGPCEVEVYYAGALIDPSMYADYGIESAEVVDGVVTVTGYGLQGFDFRVVPQFDPDSRPVRVAGAAFEFGDYGFAVGARAMSWAGSPLATVDMALSGYPLGTFAPDPADVSADGWLAAGIAIAGAY